MADVQRLMLATVATLGLVTLAMVILGMIQLLVCCMVSFCPNLVKLWMFDSRAMEQALESVTLLRRRIKGLEASGKHGLACHFRADCYIYGAGLWLTSAEAALERGCWQDASKLAGYPLRVSEKFTCENPWWSR